jgi:hypothetical protein
MGRRPLIAEGAKNKERVVFALRRYATFEPPPRHGRDESDVNASLTHWTSASVPCNADVDAS